MFDITPMLNQPFRTFGTAKNADGFKEEFSASSLDEINNLISKHKNGAKIDLSSNGSNEWSVSVGKVGMNPFNKVIYSGGKYKFMIRRP
jgi:hypothetical protein